MLISCCALAVLCAAGCHGSAPQPVAAQHAAGTSGQSYKLHGKVISVDEKTSTIVLAHDAIPGYMGGMTMPYKLQDAAAISELHPGDIINATLAVNDGDGTLGDIVITAQGRADYKPAVEYHVPSPGDAVPDFALLDQSGKTVHLSAFRGKVLLLTFVYTRCPLSDYCPRMSRNFAQIDHALAQDASLYSATHLLSVSFDPQYDTPAVLRSYGEAYTGRYGKEDFSHWTFAAPRQKDLPSLEQWFGVGVTPGENGTLAHSLSTCLIGRDGRVVAWYPENDWKVDDVVNDVRKAAAAR